MFSINENTLSFENVIFLGIIISFFMYLYYVRRVSSNSIHAMLPKRPNVSHPSPLSDSEKQLLGVAPIQRIKPLSVKLAEVGFPSSPVMPDLNVINGVAPYNPNITGNEWGGAMLSKDEDVFEQNAKAYTVEVNNRTPTPEMIPIPTMMPPSPTKVNISPNQRFIDNKERDGYNGYINQPGIVSYKTPIDAQMSKWTQFGPCSLKKNTKQRTRTCIHDGIDGGNKCDHTVETIMC